MAWNNEDYIEVKDRIIKFYAEHPDGRLVSEVIEMTDVRVTVKAYAYKSLEDTVPTTGHSWLNIPGTTNFTRGSELENAETSAWGRALAAMGYEVKKSIASRDEVAMKQDDNSAPWVMATRPHQSSQGDRPATEKQKNLLNARLDASTATSTELLAFISEKWNITDAGQILMEHVTPLLDWIETFPKK